MSKRENSGLFRVIPDTSVIINGKISKLIEKGDLTECEIVIPLAVIDELQAQASKGREIGVKGLEEIKRLRELAEKQNVEIRFSGERPGLEDIKLARSGRIDALIRDVAKAEGGELYTSDYIQALVAEAEGVPVKYIEPYELAEQFSFEEYLAPNLISLHLKAGSPPYGKILKNGLIEVAKLRDDSCSEDELNKMVEEVVAASRPSVESDITLLKSSAIIIETDKYRVSAAKPPFSDRFEVIIQRNPISDLVKEEDLEVIAGECLSGIKGVLILNADGLYVFPIAERIGEMFQEHGKLVKLIGHSKRSSTSISYYSSLNGDLEKTLDFIILNKPDYVIFDEIRRPRDFQMIHNLRASGINVIAFMNSSELKLALEKALDKIAYSFLPEVFQQIIYLRCGGSPEIYRLSSSVKIPTGLSPSNSPKSLIEVLKDDEPILEIYELDGRMVVQEVSEVFKRLEFLRKAVYRALRRLRRIDPGIFAETVALDEVIFRAAKSKLKKLGKIVPEIEKKLGVPVELIPR